MAVQIEDTFAEAFPIKIAGVLITAESEEWALTAAGEATGFATSIIGCPAEAGIDVVVPSSETPDKRPGVAILICHMKLEKLKEQVLERVADCVLTAPTTAAFNWLTDAKEKIEIKLRFFGDGYESKGEVGGRQIWKIPIMGGEFVYEEAIGAVDGVAGGNFLILGKTQKDALRATEAAVDAIRKVKGTITPFPGGVVSSGSKVGSAKYKFMKATTNEKFCPTLKDKVATELPRDVRAVYEIIINGISEEAVRAAMKAGIREAVARVPDLVKITAGNYGGKLGKYKIYLKEVV